MDEKIIGAVRTGQAQGESLPRSEGASGFFDTTMNGGQAEWPIPSEAAESRAGGDDLNRPVTAAEVAAIVREVMSELKIYVLESDITAAQNAVKGVVEQTYF